MCKTKTISFWQLAIGKTFEFNGETYSKLSGTIAGKGTASKVSDHSKIDLEAETQIVVPQDFSQFA